jgi:hypothetical protein
MNIDIKYLICSFLTLEEAIIYTGNKNIIIKNLIFRYFPISIYRNKYVRDGHYYTIKYMYKIGIKFTQYSMDLACVKGHLNIIKFFTKIGIITTRNIIKTVILYKHLDILKHLYTVASSKFDYNILLYALNNGDISSILYLLNLGLFVTKKCVNQSIFIDEIFDLVYNKRPKNFKFDIQSIYNVAKADNIRIFKIILNTRNIRIYSENFINSPKILQFLKDDNMEPHKFMI